jgi:general secretion pathway protein G
MSPQKSRGFTLVEILIVVVIVGILGSILIGYFGNTGDDARFAGTVDNLRELRSQIDLYRNQHQDRLPGVSGADPDTVFVEQLSMPTNAQGQRSPKGNQGFGDPDFPFGPYIPNSLPPNPFNKSRRVRTVTKFPDAAPGGGGPTAPGWIYEITSGRIRVNATGKAPNGQDYWSL